MYQARQELSTQSKKNNGACPGGGAYTLARQTSEKKQQSHVLTKEMFWKVLREQEKGG